MVSDIRPKLTTGDSNMFEDFDANEVTIEDLEDFLSSDRSATSAESNEENPLAAQPDESSKDDRVTETQAFARRLKEETAKARSKEREEIAKSLGYETYAELQKARETTIIEDSGYDPERISPVVEKIVQKRLSEDPRLKELDGYRQKQIETWAQKEVAELDELTGGKITKLEDIPKDVIELWKTKGSLKAAYIELQGEALIREARLSAAREQSKTSTSHLKSPTGEPIVDASQNKRALTPKEREIYKMFNPNVTDEQLSKMLKDK